VVRRDAELAPDGSNLASVLYTLQSTEERSVAYNEICATLSAAFPEFRELRFPPEGGDGRILLRWVEKGQKYGRSSFDLSDGTLSFLYLATLLLGPKPSLLICIDEPEVGLHPHAIRLVAEMLQAAAERTQLVVATHSPILVDAVKPEQVVIVEKGEDGATQFRRLDAEELKEWLKEFSLGELWLTGHLGERA
jgi:predicted ATPase